jgi:3,4-dihydroxy 2-butanone 4-phosphate synthase/GTP cyclohydrolase II
MVDPDSCASDFYTPGHINPLLGVAGGVLARDGDTEGILELVRLAGLPPVGVLIEILNPDGTMARVPQLEVFCREHNLRLCSIEKIIAYLKQR